MLQELHIVALSIQELAVAHHPQSGVIEASQADRLVIPAQAFELEGTSLKKGFARRDVATTLLPLAKTIAIATRRMMLKEPIFLNSY